MLIADTFLKDIARNGPGLAAVIRLPDMKMLFVNEQFEHYLGYKNEDLVHTELCFTDLLESYYHDRLLNQFAGVCDNVAARSFYMMYRLKNKSGSIMPFYLYAAPLQPQADIAGELFHLLLLPDLSKWGMPFTSFDTKELFLQQFDNEDFGTFEWIIDVDKAFWSPGVYRIYEIDDARQEINNVFTGSFIHPFDAARVKEETKNAIDNETVLDIEFRIITAKRNVKIIHSLARITKDKGGVPVKFAGSIRDVTIQRSIEDDLKNKVEALNHSNRELEEFAYVASHDMQEPLRKITTFSDRLTEKYKNVLTGDGALYLSRIIVSAENMRRLINDLLEFSRISKTVQPFEPVNLNFVLRQVKTDLELVIEETGTVIQAAELPVTEAIASQMKQLLDNIINNAIKFRKQDVAPVITIETTDVTNAERDEHELLPNLAYCKIQVTDNGIGFDSEYATRIFQVFQRLHGKSEYPGSGIGLAICKKILDYHHGVIYAENVPGTGARFIFILPLQQPKGRTI